MFYLSWDHLIRLRIDLLFSVRAEVLDAWRRKKRCLNPDWSWKDCFTRGNNEFMHDTQEEFAWIDEYLTLVENAIRWRLDHFDSMDATARG